VRRAAISTLRSIKSAITYSSAPHHCVVQIDIDVNIT
jgi:hypothetical protein